MEDHTIKLLQECSQGCKMGLKSIDQVQSYVTDRGLMRVIDKYRAEHEHIEAEAGKQLLRYGKESKEPEMMATAMSWMSTEMKMMMKDDDKQAAKIMMQGCNMGIETICEKLNQYSGAAKSSVELAKDLVKVEENFRDEMKPYL